MKKRILLITWFFISTTGINAKSNEGDVQNFTNIRELCRAAKEDVENFLKINPGLFIIQKQIDADIGHQEIWILKNESELKRLGLKYLSVAIEKGVVHQLNFIPIDEASANFDETLVSNLARVGLKKDDLLKREVDSKSGFVNYVHDINNHPIEVFNTATYFVCTRHLYLCKTVTGTH